MNFLSELEPKKLFEYFGKICSIPHGSGNMKAISDFVDNFAAEQGFEHYRDAANNVIIISDATPDRVSEPALILQGHMDMVCAAEDGSDFDFKKNGPRPVIENGCVHADGTSLGGDDGIAVAMMLALLTDKKLSHTRLECVFTTDEEIGLIGANALDVTHLEGRLLLNLDSEEEGIITAGCAGGVCLKANFPAKSEKLRGGCYRLSVQGLAGGHSGTEIIFQHANANKVLGRVLTALSDRADVRLSYADGGCFDNAIPRRAEAVFVSETDEKELQKTVSEIADEIKNEYASADPKLQITLKCEGTAEKDVLLKDDQKRLLFVLYQSPDGIVRMCDDLENMVETSLNLGILRLDENGMKLVFMLRSMVNSAARELTARLTSLFEFAGGKAVVDSSYDAWEFRPDSPLRDHCVAVYMDMYGKAPVVGTIHAGLEAAVIAAKLGDADCVSLGPTLFDVHTAGERLDIKSAARTYEFVRHIIERKI